MTPACKNERLGVSKQGGEELFKQVVNKVSERVQCESKERVASVRQALAVRLLRTKSTRGQERQLERPLLLLSTPSTHSLRPKAMSDVR